MGHSAAVTSTWIYAHLAQLVASNRYGMMDFGPTENMQRYGTEQPPAYPLANITSANIALFRGLNDPLADNVDVERLVRELNGRYSVEVSPPCLSFATTFSYFFSNSIFGFCLLLPPLPATYTVCSSPARQLYSTLSQVESSGLSAWHFARVLCQQTSSPTAAAIQLK